VNESERGLALLCDSGGLILEVLRNDLGLVQAQPGRLFFRLAEDASRRKALNFLVGLKEARSLLNWEWNVLLENGPATLHFSGSRVGEGLLIVGGTDCEGMNRLYDEMLLMSNEQTNRLRMAAKERSTSAWLQVNLYDEISRLNNELVGMQRELAKKNAELQRLNREKNRFLGMAAHDLRNPLYVVLAQSEFLLERFPDTLLAAHQEMLKNIYDYSLFMANLVNDLLDVAKIEAGELQLNLEVVDLEALVTRNVALNGLLAAKKGTEIELHAEPLPPALVDPAKIEQVLNNLIGNGVKFSPPGSRVEVRLVPEGDHFCLAVRDQGPGIPPEERDSLFQPFRPGRSEGTAGEKSTGLGLTIVKRIVSGHGGQIWLESEMGTGTTFFVSMPFCPKEVAT
jgi:signal transduction histidine kinase